MASSPRASKNVTVRPAVPADAPALAHVHGTSWRETYTGLISTHILAERTPELLTTRWERNLAENKGSSIVAELDDVVVGFAGSGPARAPDAGDPQLELWGLYVLNSASRRGIGTALLRGSIGESEPAYLDVLVGNAKAIAFYEKMGFERQGSKRVAHGLVNDEGQTVGEWRMYRRSS